MSDEVNFAVLSESTKRYESQLTRALEPAVRRYFEQVYATCQKIASDPAQNPQRHHPARLFQERMIEITKWTKPALQSAVEAVEALLNPRTRLHELIRIIVAGNSMIMASVRPRNVDASDQLTVRVPTKEDFLHKVLLHCAEPLFLQPHLLAFNGSDIETINRIIHTAIMSTLDDLIPTEDIMEKILQASSAPPPPPPPPSVPDLAETPVVPKVADASPTAPESATAPGPAKLSEDDAPVIKEKWHNDEDDDEEDHDDDEDLSEEGEDFSDSHDEALASLDRKHSGGARGGTHSKRHQKSTSSRRSRNREDDEEQEAAFDDSFDEDDGSSGDSVPSEDDIRPLSKKPDVRRPVLKPALKTARAYDDDERRRSVKTVRFKAPRRKDGLSRGKSISLPQPAPVAPPSSSLAPASSVSPASSYPAYSAGPTPPSSAPVFPTLPSAPAPQPSSTLLTDASAFYRQR